MSTPEYLELKEQLGRIEAMLAQIVKPPPVPKVLSPGQLMIQLAKEGKIEESKNVAKSLMGRKAA